MRGPPGPNPSFVLLLPSAVAGGGLLHVGPSYTMEITCLSNSSEGSPSQVSPRQTAFAWSLKWVTVLIVEEAGVEGLKESVGMPNNI